LWESGRRDEHDRIVLYSGLKGIAAFEIRLRGANSDKHSAMATLIPNPAWRMVWLLQTLKSPEETILIDGFMDLVAEPTADDLEHVSRIPFDDDAMRSSHGIDSFVLDVTGQDALLRHLYQPTCTICGLTSGYSGPGMKTVLPAEATAKIDFRLVPDLTPEAVGRMLAKHLDRHGFGDAELVSLEGEHPAPGDLASEVVGAAAEAVRKVTGTDAVLLPHMVATGPMHPVAAAFGIPSVGFGTGYFGSNIHAPNEHIRLADYFEGVQIAAEFFGCFGAH
jgi:acetylornithine deacetylase/succinyl-diaminopimelate desuccinylase-like protein